MTVTRIPKCISEYSREKRTEAYKRPADPWKRAKVVSVEAGRDTQEVELEMPR